jgi:hypothetical protein
MLFTSLHVPNEVREPYGYGKDKGEERVSLASNMAKGFPPVSGQKPHIPNWWMALRIAYNV